MGNITQSDEIDGYIVKENLKEKVTLKIDTGFTGYDVAIPSNKVKHYFSFSRFQASRNVIRR